MNPATADPLLRLVYAVLDTFFVVFHGTLIFFILSGWIWPKTQRFHLFVMILTFLSWFGLGFFYGFGYCLCTDWHWRVKEALGERNLPDTYVKYYLDRITGAEWPPRFIHMLVLSSGLTAFAASVAVNYWRQPPDSKPAHPHVDNERAGSDSGYGSA